MHTFTSARAVFARNKVPTWIFLAISRRFFSPDQLYVKPVPVQARFQEFANVAVIVSRWVQRRNANQILRQRDQIRALCFNPLKKRLAGFEFCRHGVSKVRAS